MTLRLCCRAFVNEKVSEIDISIAQIVAEDALAEVLKKQLAGRRFPVELAALMAGAIERNVGLAIIGHKPTEEGRQEPLAIFHQASDHLLGVEGRSLLSEIDIAVDLARLSQDDHVGKAMGVGHGPERRRKTDVTNGARQGACRLEIVAVNHRNISTDGSVLRHIPIEAAADLDLDFLCGNVIEKLSGQRVLLVDDRHDLEQPVEGYRDCWRFHVARDHGSHSQAMQSTRYRRDSPLASNRRPWISVSKPGNLRSNSRASRR